MPAARDWRAENVRFAAEDVVAVYDWHSVCCVAEPWLVAYSMAYTARCEHSDALTDFGRKPPSQARASIPEGSARAFLARHAEQLLGG